MKINKILLLIIISIFCFVPVVSAKDAVVINDIKPFEISEGIEISSDSKLDLKFNDLGQFIKYELTLKNNTNKDLYVNDLVIDGASQNFIKYILDEKSRSKIIKSNSEESVLINLITKNEKGAGKNLSDNINFKILLNDKIENPNTTSNLIRTIILVILGAVAATFIMTKFNRKKGIILTIVVCFILLGTSFVFADDTIVVNFNGKVSYSSQNYMETSGTLIENHHADYRNSKDIWAYSDKVKNINISSENNNIETYAHTFDLTINDKQRVKAYLVNNGDQNIPYDLYIISNGVIYAPEDATGLFSFPNVESINGLENVVFDNTTKMTGMFINNKKLSFADTSTINLSKVLDSSYMFYECYKLDIKEEDFELTNVVNQKYMFVLKEEDKNNLINTLLNNNTVIKYQEDFVTNEDFAKGFVKYDDGTTYFVGNVNNNYLWFGGFVWRIVNIDKKGNIKLVTEQSLTEVSAGEQTVTENQANDVINKGQATLKNNYLGKWLTEVFLPNFSRKGDLLTIKYPTPDIESVNTTWNSKVSLLTVNDTLKAGLYDKYADIYNNLSYYPQTIGSYLYTMTGPHTASLADIVWHPDKNEGIRIRYIRSSSIVRSDLSDSRGIRPVITIDGNMILSSGDGTLANPYIIEGEAVAPTVGNMHVGEYVKLANGDTAKVMAVDDSGVKFILTRNILNTASFNSTSNIFSTETTGYTALTGYFNSTLKRDTQSYGKPAIIGYLDTSLHDWYIGTYKKGQDYNVTLNKKSDYTGSYAIVRVGEMFAAYDVNDDFITTSGYQYTMTPGTASATSLFITNGGLQEANSYGHDVIRPVFYLKTDLKLTGGTGRYNDPYIIE